MKQVISIADFATMLNVINEKIDEIERQTAFSVPYRFNDDAESIAEREKEMLRKNQVYQSLLHAKKVLEDGKVEIEVPDLEVEK